jgi:hypothetical protein
MIIGRQHRYLFVEVPNTASTAIATELVTHYGGERFLHKHATYGEFLKTKEGRDGGYFVFSTVRNPLDAALTVYFKMKSNHKGRFTSARMRNTPSVTNRHVEQFEFTQTGADYPAYFRKFRTSVYNNYYLLQHERFDYVMRFERLQEEFAEVQPIPHVNRTGGKSRDFWEYYTEDVRDQAMRLYWPYMRRWGYAFPEQWGPPPEDWGAELKFRSTEALASLLNRTLGLGPNSQSRWAVSLRDGLRRFWS